MEAASTSMPNDTCMEGTATAGAEVDDDEDDGAAAAAAEVVAAE